VWGYSECTRSTTFHCSRSSPPTPPPCAPSTDHWSVKRGSTSQYVPCRRCPVKEKPPWKWQIYSWTDCLSAQQLFHSWNPPERESTSAPLHSIHVHFIWIHTLPYIYIPSVFNLCPPAREVPQNYLFFKWDGGFPPLFLPRLGEGGDRSMTGLTL